MRPKSRLPWDLRLPVSGGLSADGSQGKGALCMEAEGSGLGRHRAEAGGMQLVESPHGFSVAAWISQEEEGAFRGLRSSSGLILVFCLLQRTDWKTLMVQTQR